MAAAPALQTRDHSARIAALEKDPVPAARQPGRNSGVIHAGVHHAPGSMKVLFCREGVKAAEAFCADMASGSRGSGTRRSDDNAESQRQVNSDRIRNGELGYPALNSANRFRRVSGESPAISESIREIRAFKASRTPDEIRPRDNRSISEPSNP